jgi:hypothetical protein
LSPPLTTELLFTSTEAMGIPATPVQRAICRAIDALPLGKLAKNIDVETAFGGAQAVMALPVGTRPLEFALLCAIRSGKTHLAVATAICSSQTCHVGHLGHGEIPRVSIVSTRTDTAQVAFDILVGTLRAKSALRSLLVEEPTADSCLLRHPSGPVIEVKVVAGARAGSTLVARWSAGVIFDEAPRMTGADDAVVNLEHARAAVLGRMLDGAQILYVGSPWAPMGPVYEMVQDHWGKPTRQLVVVRAAGPVMNPKHWTPERVEDLRSRDPGVYRTDVLGEFADPDASLFNDDIMKACTRAAPFEAPPEAKAVYVAAIDPGTRNNAFTLAIAGRVESRVVVAVARQWKPQKGAPLSPAAVLAEVAAVCKAYGVCTVHTDGWSADALKDLARPLGIELVDRTRSPGEKVELYTSLATMFAQGEVELPPVSEVRSDLLSVRKRVTQTGVAVVLPVSGGGRHADFAPSIAIAVREAPATASHPKAPPPQFTNIDNMPCGFCGNAGGYIGGDSEGIEITPFSPYNPGPWGR